MAELFDGTREPTGFSFHLPTVTELSYERFIPVAMIELERLTALFGLGNVEAVQADLETAGPDGHSTMLEDLHYRILAALQADRRQLHAYQLGRALRDTCWLVEDQDTFDDQLNRSRLATLEGWIIQAGDCLPEGTGPILRESLENWSRWLNSNRETVQKHWINGESSIIDALKHQSHSWHALLSDGSPGRDLPLSAEAWEGAGDRLTRSGQRLLFTVLGRFWIPLLVAVATAGGILALELGYATGATAVWSAVLTAVGLLGATGIGVHAATSKVAKAVESEIVEAARVSAHAWQLTWLPYLQGGGAPLPVPRQGIVKESSVDQRPARETPEQPTPDSLRQQGGPPNWNSRQPAQRRPEDWGRLAPKQPGLPPNNTSPPAQPGGPTPTGPPVGAA